MKKFFQPKLLQQDFFQPKLLQQDFAVHRKMFHFTLKPLDSTTIFFYKKGVILAQLQANFHILLQMTQYSVRIEDSKCGKTNQKLKNKPYIVSSVAQPKKKRMSLFQTMTCRSSIHLT